MIDPGAELGESVSVGVCTVIEDGVTIGDHVTIGNFTTIRRGTRIGAHCQIFHNCSIGEAPQDLKYQGEATQVHIGNHVIIRESVTINRGTAALGITRIGDHSLLMAYCHVAHDCQLGKNVVLANLTTLGGHVYLEDYVSLGGGVLVHQFCRVGSHAFVGGGYRIVQDVPPYILAAGEPLRYAGINRVGLRRRGFSTDTCQAIKKAYRLYFRSNYQRSAALTAIEKELDSTPEVEHIIKFIRASERGIL